MVIVLEGPDGAGKSTLGEVLTKSLGAVLLHTGGPIQSVKEFKHRTTHLHSFTRCTEPQPLIIDRLPFISEFVYGGSSIIHQEELCDQFDFFCNMFKPHIVYCRTDPETMVKNIVKGKPHKPEEWVKHITESAPKIQARYENFFSKYPPHSIYDYKETKADVRSLPVL
jgi:thymidylate kinase